MIPPAVFDEVTTSLHGDEAGMSIKNATWADRGSPPNAAGVACFRNVDFGRRDRTSVAACRVGFEPM